jgi:F-box-like
MSLDLDLEVPLSQMDPDPRLLPFTTSNEPLPDDLKGTLSIYLGHLTRTAATLDAQKREPHAKTRDLQKKLGLVKMEHKRFLNITAPIRRVPAEVIAMILSAYLSEYMPLRCDGRYRFIRLRTVCSRWREVAFSTPELWNSLSYIADEDGFGSGVDVPRAVGRITRWFSKAGGLPLRLEVQRDPIGVGSLEITSLLQALPRLSHLSLLPIASYQVFVEVITKPNTPSRVRTLVLALKDYESSVTGPDSLDLAFPMLFRLSLRYERGGAAMILSHNHLRILQLHKVIFPAHRPVHSLLQHLPALEELYATFCIFQQSNGTQDNQLPRHPSLRRLVVGYPSTLSTEIHHFPCCPKLEQIILVPSLNPRSLTTDPAQDPIPIYLKLHSEPHGRLTLDLSHMTRIPPAVSPLPAACTVSQLNLPTLFESAVVGMIIASFTSEKPCSVHAIISRSSPFAWQDSQWMEWATSLSRARPQLSNVNFYVPEVSPELSEWTVNSIKELGINLYFLPQTEIRKRLGDAELQDYLNGRPNWDY